MTHEKLFISDLHLSQGRADLIDAFFYFLDSRAQSACELYILGDFFDVWLGDNAIEPWHKRILQKLQTYSKHHQLFFMKGNRDFLIGETFCNLISCELLPNEHVIQIDNQKILLLHGDTLCTLDKYYQVYRFLVNLSWVKKFFQILPRSIKKRLAKFLQKQSKQHQRQFDHPKFDINPTTVMQKFHQFSVDTIIHGHTHRPYKHIHSDEFNKNNLTTTKTRWVLGDWNSKWWVLSYKNGLFQQESYPITVTDLK